MITELKLFVTEIFDRSTSIIFIFYRRAFYQKRDSLIQTSYSD